MDTTIAIAIFAITYALIVSERVHKTTAALAGGAAVIAFGVLDTEEAFEAIDLNVIFLLAGMMVLAGTLARTGFFQWVAIRSVRLSRGEPFRLLIILCVVTGVLSAFLDNVTTVVLTTPITLSISRALGISPVPYLISQVLASNIGGTATLIGDPPNILIGSAAGLDFAAFLVNLAPVTIVVFLAFLVTLRFLFRSSLEVPDDRREAILEGTEAETIVDRRLMMITLVIVGVTLVGFLLHSALGFEAATIALLGATVLLLVARIDPHEAFRDVEWSTLFFFVGLFMLVEAVVEVGIVGGVAEAIATAADGNVATASIALLWVSAIASAIVDNIPYTATAIPIVQNLVADGMAADPLWWSLALGACLGGNLTLVGASANIVTANMAARAGHPIGFFEFMKYGSVVVAESLVISTGYVWLRYLA